MGNRPAPAPSTLWGIGLGGVGALLALTGLLATHRVEAIKNPMDPVLLAVYVLPVLGPAALFWAVGRALDMGLFWLFGTAAWALLGYVMVFVAPPATASASLPTTVGFMALVFAATVAALTPPLYGLGWALFRGRIHRHDLRRAVRQAALGGLYLVACLGMALFSLLNGLNALLLFVVLALMEFFFLSRG